MQDGSREMLKQKVRKGEERGRGRSRKGHATFLPRWSCILAHPSFDDAPLVASSRSGRGHDPDGSGAHPQQQKKSSCFSSAPPLVMRAIIWYQEEYFLVVSDIYFAECRIQIIKRTHAPSLSLSCNRILLSATQKKKSNELKEYE